MRLEAKIVLLFALFVLFWWGGGTLCYAQALLPVPCSEILLSGAWGTICNSGGQIQSSRAKQVPDPYTSFPDPRGFNVNRISEKASAAERRSPQPEKNGASK